jgi:hypothetical protein
VPHDGPRSGDDAGARELRAPAEIDVFTTAAHLGVKPSDRREQVHPGEEAGVRHGKDLADFVVLGLVKLPFLDSRDENSETVDAETDLQ